MSFRQLFSEAVQSRCTRITLCVATLAIATGACAVQVDAPDAEVAQTAQPLWFTTWNFWANGRIPICFGAERWTRNAAGTLWPEPMPTGSAAWVEQRDRIRQLLEQQYESIPNAQIDFYGWDVCPQAEVGTFTGGLRITLRDDGGFPWGTQRCGPNDYYRDGDMDGDHGPCFGIGATTGYETNISTSRYGYAWGQGYDGAVLHEVGHALSFDHEHRRPDAEKCGTNTIRSGDPDGIRLTVYDYDSVMNSTYCYGTGQLSHLDRLGLEIVYASHFTGHPISGKASFKLGSGALVLRRDDAVVTDWSARGALAEAYENGTVSWSRNGSSQGDSLEYDATRLPAGSSDMSATFRDFRGRTHSTTTQRVQVDNQLHSALAMASLTP